MANSNPNISYYSFNLFNFLIVVSKIIDLAAEINFRTTKYLSLPF